MRNIILTSLSILVVLLMVTCQSGPKNGPNSSTNKNDSVNNQAIKPSESGYADINNLKMYYEVYGEGKPIVLLHGSYMTIPLNWAHIIPLLAKDRKVIAAEMQGHGRTRDISRKQNHLLFDKKCSSKT